MNGGEFLESEFTYSIMACRFLIWYFFNVILSKSMYISAFHPSSSPSNFHHVAYPFSFFPRVSRLLYFTLEFFSFFCIRLLVCYRVISIDLLVEFFFFLLECSVSCFILLFFFFCIAWPFVVRCLISPSFSSTFWFISWSWIVIFLVLLFSYFPAFFLCFVVFLCFF